MNPEGMFVGDQVAVRSAGEIMSTLDADGTLDGLPFMPEMLGWCGKSFRIQRRSDKTCVDGHPIRRFPANDVVVPEGPRCDGGSHNGCKHGCRIYWKQAWLRPINAENTEIRRADGEIDKLHAIVEFAAGRARTRKISNGDRQNVCSRIDNNAGDDASPLDVSRA
jgi:hypothetical protein